MKAFLRFYDGSQAWIRETDLPFFPSKGDVLIGSNVELHVRETVFDFNLGCAHVYCFLNALIDDGALGVYGWKPDGDA